MIPPAVAAPAATLAVLLGDWVNREVRGWLPDDPPRPGRKQHDRPIPLAGIVLFFVALAWLVPAGAWWVLGAVLVTTAVGFLDDRGKERDRDLDWRPKAAGLLLAAALATAAVIDPLACPGEFALGLAFVFVVTNSTNFLDNTDGVSCALSATSLLLATGGQGPFGAVGFAALGFLALNWPGAIVFLGDAGAYLLGTIVAVTVLPQVRADWTALALVAVQLADFAQVVVARLVLGVAPWIGDRRHLTHIAQNAGLPRVLVAPGFVLLALGVAWFGR